MTPCDAALPAMASGTSGDDVVFEAARAGDDAAIRALLRQEAVGGDIRLTMQRDPDARFAAGIEGERHHMIVGRRRGDGCVVAVCSRSVRSVWINGEAARIGYLGQLRRGGALRARVRLLAQGFAACQATRRPANSAASMESPEPVASRRCAVACRCGGTTV
ncbi:MAG: hypothetical protein WD042_19410 [Phycisphaeraceae bacterium]